MSKTAGRISFKWLAPRAQKTAPVTFGAPWARGTLKKGESLAMAADDGNAVAVQTKNTAYWPDGSIKWTAHSAVLDTEKQYAVMKGASGQPGEGCGITAVQDADDAVTVRSGLLDCTISKGGKLITALNRRGLRPVEATLVALLETVEEREDCTVSSVLRFTVAYALTPRGRSLQDRGLRPRGSSERLLQNAFRKNSE